MTRQPTRPPSVPAPAVGRAGSRAAAAMRATPSDAKRASCEETYATLVAGVAHPRTRANLTHLRRALEHLVATKSSDFSIANVVRVRAELGMKSPAASAVYNVGGEVFRTLIDAYAAAYGAAKPAATNGEYDDLVYAIADEALAQRVRWLVNENRGLQVQLDAARAAFGKLRAIPPRALLAHAQGDLAAETTAPSFSAEDMAAVRRFLEKADDLLPCEWDAETGALRLTRSGMQVAGPRFRQVLEAIAGDQPGGIRAGADPRRLPAAETL